ncbi:MAG: major facilitator superfamily 1 [Deltaproteobacteria bacterium]|nr:major facilitator superfamily 1 [Deltaproteobacteria bacterium]
MTRFVAIWAGQLVSMLGSNLTGFGLAVWMYQRTGDITDLTLIAIATYLPHVVVAPLGGVLADRHDRRKLMLAADLGAAMCTAALLASAMTDTLSPALAIALVSVSASCNALQWPAWEAAIVALVPPGQLGRANGLCELSRGTSQLLAPVLAGLLLAAIDLPGIMAIDLASFVLGGLPLLVLPIPAHGPRVPRTRLAELADAWRFVANRRGLVAMLVLFSVTNFTFAVVDLMLKPLVLGIAGPWELGVVLSTVGVGMVAGSLVMTAWGGPRRKVAAILCFQLVEGGALMLGGAQPTLAPLCVAAFAYGTVIPLTFGCARVIWQVKVPPEMQGRVTALRNAIVMLAIPIGYVAAIPLARVLAPAHAVIAMGLVTCATAIGWFGFAPYRHIETDLDDLLVPCLDARQAS